MESSLNLYEATQPLISDQITSSCNPQSSSSKLNSPPSSSSSSSSSSKLAPIRPLSPNLSRAAMNAAVAELAADLNSPEISFDLQQFINSEIASAQAASTALAAVTTSQLQSMNEDSVSLFTELMESKRGSSGGQQQQHQQQQQQHQQQVNGNNTFNGSFALQPQRQDRYASDSNMNVKREPGDENGSCQTQNYSSSSSSYGTYSPPLVRNNNNSANNNSELYGVNVGLISSRAAASAHLHNGNSGNSSIKSQGSSSKSSKKHADKGTDEYKKRRERNNIAVRKSREKAKQRSRETEKRVSELMRDNDSLRKRVDLLGNQLNVLKTLLTNVGVPSESVENEITRSLQLDGLL